MAWRFGKFGAGPYDVWDGVRDNDAPIYAWSSQVSTSPQVSVPDGASAPMDEDPVPLAIPGAPGADVFVLDKTTLSAATAVPPSIALISDYKASEGDLIDFSSLLQISYAPLSADAAQLRVAEDVSATFATLQLNVGNATNPFWAAVVKLDGVHAGDAVNVLLDATHTVHLSAEWLI